MSEEDGVGIIEPSVKSVSPDTENAFSSNETKRDSDVKAPTKKEDKNFEEEKEKPHASQEVEKEDVINLAIKEIKSTAEKLGVRHSFELDSTVINELRKRIGEAKNINEALKCAKEILKMVEHQVAEIHRQIHFKMYQASLMNINITPEMSHGVFVPDSPQNKMSTVIFDSRKDILSKEHPEKSADDLLLHMSNTALYLKKHVMDIVQTEHPEYLSDTTSEN